MRGHRQPENRCQHSEDVSKKLHAGYRCRKAVICSSKLFREGATRAQLDTAPGAPVSDPAGLEFRLETRRIGDRRSVRPARRGQCQEAPGRLLCGQRDERSVVEGSKKNSGNERWKRVVKKDDSFPADPPHNYMEQGGELRQPCHNYWHEPDDLSTQTPGLAPRTPAAHHPAE